MLLFFAGPSRSPFLHTGSKVFLQEGVPQSLFEFRKLRIRCACVCEKKFLVLQREVPRFCSNFHKTNLKLSCSHHANLSKNSSFVVSKTSHNFRCDVYLLVAPHFHFRFYVWRNCFSRKKQLIDRPLSNLFSVAVEDNLKEFLFFSLIQWTEVDERFYIYTITSKQI